MGGVIEKDAFPSEDEMKKIMTDGGFSDVVINDNPGIYLASAVAVK